MARRGRAPLLMACIVAVTAAATSDRGGASDVRLATGAQTRVVWVQGDGSDPFATGRALVLMGLDTDDGRGERVILGTRASYVKPMITPRGDRIIYSTHPTLGAAAVYVVAFDGSGLRTLGPGFAFGVGRDAADGSEWVDIGTAPREWTASGVVRVTLDRPDRRVPVWTRTPVAIDTFQVSRDGRFAAGQFPWPRVGLADLASGSWRRVGDGCWTGLPQAERPLLSYLDDTHRHLQFVDPSDDRRWRVRISSAPGFGDAEVYHPRWTNHPRFLVVTGPYDRGGRNQVRRGGPQAEVWLARFNDGFTGIESWTRVTRNALGDAYPDAWVRPGTAPMR